MATLYSVLADWRPNRAPSAPVQTEGLTQIWRLGPEV